MGEVLIQRQGITSKARELPSINCIRLLLTKSAKSSNEQGEDREDMDANVEKMKANAVEWQSKIAEHEDIMCPEIGNMCKSQRCQYY